MTPEQERLEQEQLELFLAHAARTPELQTRLHNVDPYEVVEIGAAEGFQFGVFTLHRAVCTGYVRSRPLEWCKSRGLLT